MPIILPNKITPAIGKYQKRDGKPAEAARAEGGPTCGGILSSEGEETVPLGIYAKSVHTAPKFDAMELRGQRFALQSVARKILPESRTAKCLRFRAFGRQVEVWKNHEHKTAHYAGLQTCASVWACPVCAAKIAERRRAEVLAAMSAHKAQGGNVHLLTLTAPHSRRDQLQTLLDQQAKALKRFWNDRQTKAILAEMGYLGLIRAREVTHGRKSEHDNGWHPHYHILLFTGHEVSQERFDQVQRRDWEVRLYLRWAMVCEKEGLGTPSMAHGLKLDDGEKAGSYASKWGLEDEITKGHTKKAKAGGETPFDLLRAVLADSEDRQAAALFQEFAKAFKGQRQLYWSSGLKARFAVGELTDAELAARVEEDAELLGSLTVEQWRDVLFLDVRGLVLEIAAKTSWWHLLKFLDLIDGARFNNLEIDKAFLAEARELILGGYRQ